MENCGVYNFQNKVLTPRVQISGFLREDGKILLRVIDNGTEVDILLPLLETKPEHPVLAGEAQEESNPPAEI